jgi:hypothetical protein
MKRESHKWIAAREQQLATFRMVRSHRWARKLGTNTAFKGFNGHGQPLLQRMLDHTAIGDAYFIGEEISPALTQIPPYEFWPDIPLSPYGFALLEKPQRLGKYEMDAFSWGTGTPGWMHFVKYAWMSRDKSISRSAGLMPIGVSDWRFGDEFPRPLTDWPMRFGSDYRLAMRGSEAFVAGFFAFARQMIPSDEALEKHLKGQEQEPNPVVYIELRRRKSSQITPAESESAEYSHRWLVRGHWRNQWYPTFGRHMPAYVTPYVKGPADKPLVVKQKIFGVVR